VNFCEMTSGPKHRYLIIIHYNESSWGGRWPCKKAFKQKVPGNGCIGSVPTEYLFSSYMSLIINTHIFEYKSSGESSYCVLSVKGIVSQD
jgi:hypothetical protein